MPPRQHLGGWEIGFLLWLRSFPLERWKLHGDRGVAVAFLALGIEISQLDIRESLGERLGFPHYLPAQWLYETQPRPGRMSWAGHTLVSGAKREVC